MKMMINGQRVDASDGKTVNAVNPATGKVIDTFPYATREDVACALEAAQQGKADWANTSISARAKMLYRFADLLEKNAEDIARLQCAETGKPISQARGDVANSAALTRNFTECGKHIESTLHKDLYAAGLGDLAFDVREPLGVVVCIVPFNYPIDTLLHKVAPALIMGNAVIIKPSSDAALTLIRCTELLLEAGVPGNVAQIVTGPGASIGDYLVDTDQIDCINFTGSTEAGVSLTQRSAKYLHRVLMELGGNDPVVIFDDANIEAAVEDAMSRVSNTGQTCCATKRFIVHNAIREKFTQALIERLKKVKVGDPQLDETEMGCCVSEKAAREIEAQVNETVAQGAALLYGGTRDGAFYAPTVLGSVTKDMDVAKDMEIFGPVYPIIGFDTEEDAIAIANQTIYGLNGGVMSGDMIRGLRVASKIQAGTVVSNGMSQWRSDSAPFGGYKMSGIGREGLNFTLEEMSQLKTIVIKGVK